MKVNEECELKISELQTALSEQQDTLQYSEKTVSVCVCVCVCVVCYSGWSINYYNINSAFVCFAV